MTMTIDDSLKHLDEKAQQKLLLTDEERIRSIRIGTWVGIEHVKEVLDRLEDMLQTPEVTRPPCMLVVGPAFSGKTSIAEHFVSMHPPDLSPDNETTVAPVVMIDAPPKPDLSDFYSRILDKLMAPYKPTASSHEKYAQVKRLFRELGVRMLAFMTVCPEHKVMLQDRCPQCESPLSFHRAEMGRGGVDDALEMSMCHACGMDLRRSSVRPVQTYLPEIYEWMLTMAKKGVDAHELDDWNVMHHLARLMLSEIPYLNLHEHLCRQVGAPEWQMSPGRISIESCELELRHHLIQLIGYLMLDLPGRLDDA